MLHRPILSLFLPLVSPDPFLPSSLLTDSQRAYYKVARAIAETFAVSTAAWLGSLPLMIYHFHLVTPIAPFANLLLIPIAFCVLGTAILSTLVATLGLASVCAILNNANFLFATLLTNTAGFFAGLPVPISHFYTSAPNAVRPPCKITVLDIPRGGASTLVSTRDGKDWLIDTGNARDLEPTVASVLREHAGVTHIDGLILTHSDAGHIGGASGVISKFKPGQIYLPQANNSSSTYRQLAAELATDGRRVAHPPTPGEWIKINPNTQIQILYPPASPRHHRYSDDACLVFLLETHGWRVLFTGDAGFNTENYLLRMAANDLRADIVVSGSHRSDHSGTPNFLAAADPAVIIANARSFDEENPGEDGWRKTIAERDITLFDQAETGGVDIDVHPNRLEIRAFLSDQSFTLYRAR